MITVKSIYGDITGYENDHITQEIISCGGFRRPEIGMILNFIEKDDVALDIGAHIGSFSIPMNQKIGKDGKLFAFEANPNTFDILQKNINANGMTAILFNKGVAEQNGFLYLRAKEFENREKIESEKNLNTGADYLTTSVPNNNSSSTVKVDLIKIDDVIKENVNFIKVDVEGMELSVFRSATNVIDKSRPIIYSEYYEPYITRAGYSYPDFQEFFKSRNYDFFINAGYRKASNDDYLLVRVPGPQYIRGQCDFLLVPSESDRYPKKFINWYQHAFFMYMWNRFRNFLKEMKAISGYKK